MSTTPRFFVPPEAIIGDEAVLPQEVLHHARTVLRLRPGEPLILHDGKGFAHEAVLGEGKTATARISRSYALDTEPDPRVVIAQALPKTGEKMEQVLQHGTEVGASGFLIFPSERSVARLETRDKVEKRLERWREIVKSAAEQSRRGVLPTVEWEAKLSGIAPRLTVVDLALILHESAEVPMRVQLNNVNSSLTTILLLVGPEGGWTDAEVGLMEKAGAHSVHLGPRILRTETAALVALTQVLYARES